MKLNRKNLSARTALTYTLWGSLITFAASGCKDKEPEPTPAPEPVVAQEPELISLEDALNEEPVETASPSYSESETVHSLASSDFTPNIKAAGPYVLQVGTSSYQSDADAMIRKIKKLGYDAYTVEVENPADLQGRFIRVRLGYFSTLSDARLFGHNVLLPNNIPFWIDNRDNDHLMGTSQSASYEDTQYEESKKAESTPAAPVADEWDTPTESVVEETPSSPAAPAPEPADEWSTATPAEEPMASEEPVAPAEPMTETAPTPAQDEWSTPEETSQPQVVAPEPQTEPASANDSWEAQPSTEPNAESWSDDEGWE